MVIHLDIYIYILLKENHSEKFYLYKLFGLFYLSNNYLVLPYINQLTKYNRMVTYHIFDRPNMFHNIIEHNIFYTQDTIHYIIKHIEFCDTWSCFMTVICTIMYYNHITYCIISINLRFQNIIV